MKTAKISLAGQSYTMRELPRRQNAAWREAFQTQFAEIADALGGLGDTTVTGDNLGAVVRELAAQVNGAVDKILGLLYAYSPALEADKARIDAEAFDSEIVEAFVAVLGLAYPFGTVMDTVTRLAAPGLPRG